MEVVKSYEILSQFDGEFVGGFEVLEGCHFGELYDADGDFSTYLKIDDLSDVDLYRTIIDEFAANKGCHHSDVYLTDEEHSEILLAL